MAGRGPAPKHPDHRARKNKSLPLRTLPTEGRKGRAPKWPLGDDVALRAEVTLGRQTVGAATREAEGASTARLRAAARKRLATAQRTLVAAEAELKAQRAAEAALWRELWRTPQAVQWERNQTARTVAQYVRWTIKAETVGSIRAAAEARQLADRIGLNDLALQRLRWEIPDDARGARPPILRSARNSRYAGLRVVDDVHRSTS